MGVNVSEPNLNPNYMVILREELPLLGVRSGRSW